MSSDSLYKAAKFVALKTLIVCSFAAFYIQSYSTSLQSSYLNNYFDLHVCLSIRPSVLPSFCPSVLLSVVPVPSGRKLISIPASVSQNVSNKSCLACVTSKLISESKLPLTRYSDYPMVFQNI